MNEYTANNQGKLPPAAADVTNNVEPGYYDKTIASGQGSITVATAAANGALGATAPNDRVVIVKGAKCGASGATVQGSARQVSIQYLLETSGGYDPICQQS